MKTQHVELWQRLEQFQLDSAEAALPFSVRLARENNWTAQHTQRVIGEYKRFAFLAVVAGHPVSPSEDVDQVWHLHLTFSENYWKVFCPEILDRALHHQPTKGGCVERAKFDDWYARTLESYREHFGEAAPADIWPEPNARRAEKHDFMRVDRKRNWVIPKPQLRFNSRFIAALISVTLLFAGTGAMFAEGANPFNWRGPDFLEFYVALFSGCFLVALWLRKKLRQPGVEMPLPEINLDAYETAFLNGGKILAVNTAIATLVNQGAMRVNATERRVSSLYPEPESLHILEKRVHHAAASIGGTLITDVRLSAKPNVEIIAENLKAQGLVVSDAQARRAIAIPLTLALSPIVAGVVKVGIGTSRGRPVGFLIVLCIISFVAALIAFARRPLRSKLGEAVFQQLKTRHTGSIKLTSDMNGMAAAQVAMVVGLFGMSALAGTELDELRKALQPQNTNGGGGDGCGGGCGGGGCGGCGGD